MTIIPSMKFVNHILLIALFIEASIAKEGVSVSMIMLK